MKPIFAILFSFLSLGVFAQGQGTKSTASTNKSASNCYEEWYSILKERGARPVANGSQDVVISIRNGNYSECFMGKVNVLDGKIAGRPQVQKVDGTYEDWGKEVSQKYFNSDGTRTTESNTLLTINNGMSGDMILTDGDIVKCFFYQAIQEKPKANKKAPAPSTLVK
jgi:hypothetical protein